MKINYSDAIKNKTMHWASFYFFVFIIFIFYNLSTNSITSSGTLKALKMLSFLMITSKSGNCPYLIKAFKSFFFSSALSNLFLFNKIKYSAMSS